MHVTGAVGVEERRDWFWIPFEWIEHLGTAPSLSFDRAGNAMAHRSHLPLIRERIPGWKVVERAMPVVESSVVDAETAKLGFQLYPRQHAARQFIQSRRGTLLGDTMRLGKTLSALSAHSMAEGPLLIVAPLMTRHVWKGWVRRLWPDCNMLVAESRGYDRDQVRAADVVFVHYNILSRWSSLAANLRPATTIFDEAHVLSNHRNNQGQTASGIAYFTSTRVIGLTGTPLWNRVSGLWGVLSTISPEAWGDWHRFAKRYADGRKGRHGFEAKGVTHSEELRARLSEVLLARSWEDLPQPPPPTIREIVKVPLDEPTVYQLERAHEALRSCGTSVMAGELARYRRLLGDFKRRAAVERATEILRSGESCVLWTWHRDLALAAVRDLKKAGFSAKALHGQVSASRRDEAIEAFQASSDPRALVLTLGVGQVGIDLSRAKHAIFAEHDWTPVLIGQAEMRTFDPTRPMTIHHLVADHEVELRVVEALVRKVETGRRIGAAAAEASIDVIGAAFDHLSDPGDMSRLAQAVLASKLE